MCSILSWIIDIMPIYFYMHAIDWKQLFLFLNMGQDVVERFPLKHPVFPVLCLSCGSSLAWTIPTLWSCMAHATTQWVQKHSGHLCTLVWLVGAVHVYYTWPLLKWSICVICSKVCLVMEYAEGGSLYNGEFLTLWWFTAVLGWMSSCLSQYMGH